MIKLPLYLATQVCKFEYSEHTGREFEIVKQTLVV